MLLGEDEMSGELPGERWMPTQTVQTILLSVISLLSAPNFSSPANVDANVEWRTNPEGFHQHIARLVEKANQEKPSYVVIPHPDTNPEERKNQVAKIKAMNEVVEDILDEEMMYDSHEPSEDEQEDSSEENHSQSGI
jgi:ubiquitin-conjugating enzyme E2 R